MYPNVNLAEHSCAVHTENSGGSGSQKCEHQPSKSEIGVLKAACVWTDPPGAEAYFWETHVVGKAFQGPPDFRVGLHLVAAVRHAMVAAHVQLQEAALQDLAGPGLVVEHVQA
jgi:hypothetical protein